MSLLKFKIKAKSENPTRTLVETRGFKLVLAEPDSLGGTNAGPNPVEYELAAFSGCITVMGHLIAKEMGFELRGLEAEIEGDLNPGRFSGKSMKERAGFQEIRVNIKPDADADAETLKKWVMAIEERCPVSDNLAHATPIKVAATNGKAVVEPLSVA